jgi:hypothetical protein
MGLMVELAFEDPRFLLLATLAPNPTFSSVYRRGIHCLVFYNTLHYCFITFQVTGSRIDFVSILAGRTWSAFIIESDFILASLLFVCGEGLVFL